MISAFNLKSIVAAALGVSLSIAFAQTATDRVNAITSALRNQDFDKSLQLLQPALREFPKDERLWTLRGLAYSGEGHKEEALAAFQNALKVAPTYLPALEGAAQLEYDAGSGNAVSLLQRVLKLHPDDPTSHAMLAAIAYKKDDCVTAVRHFEQIDSTIEAQPGALQEYANCLVDLKQTEKAISIFQRILESHPDDPIARRGLAAAQLTAGQAQDAISTLKPLLDASSPDVNTMQLAAAAYEANKDTPNAVNLLHEAIVKNPTNLGLYVDFANISMTHQSFQAGIDVLNAGINLQPRAAELYLARGVLYVHLADYEKAEADFEKAEQLDPHQSSSAAAQGLMAEEKNQNDPAKALATVRSKLAKKPSDAFLWYLQAELLAQKALSPNSADFQQALQSARKAVRLQPSLSAAHDVLAKLYLQAGQTQSAIKECRLALQADPKDQAALYHLVLALRKTKDKTEIPDLLQRLAKARQDATKEEAERDRYKLVVEPAQSNFRP